MMIKKRIRQAIAIDLLAVNCFFILVSFFFTSCKNKTDTEVFIFPKEYEGVALIFFGLEKGSDDKIADNKIIYEFPSNGILFMRKHLRNANIKFSEYYYKDANGRLTPISTINEDSTSKRNKIIVDNTAGNNDFGEYKSYNYIVISASNENRFSGDVLNKYVDSIVKSFKNR